VTGKPTLRALAAAFAVAACAIALGSADPAEARGGDERVEASAQGVCGRASSSRLRLRAEGGEIRVDTDVRTSRLGFWKLTVLHERRVAARVRVRATRASRGFQHRVFLPDYEGADAVSVRATAPSGEICTAAATVAAPASRDDDSRS
jgi:hypothetical protein